MMQKKRIFQKSKTRLLKFSNVILSSLLGFLFGCRISPIVAAYGMPTADYKISGTVFSSDQNQPVRGLTVSVRDTSTDALIFSSTKTDISGRYTVQFSNGPWNPTIDLRVEDTDSTENGPFFTKDTIITIPESELKEPDGTWYYGHTEKIVNLKVDRKK